MAWSLLTQQTRRGDIAQSCAQKQKLFIATFRNTLFPGGRTLAPQFLANRSIDPARRRYGPGRTRWEGRNALVCRSVIGVGHRKKVESGCMQLGPLRAIVGRDAADAMFRQQLCRNVYS